MFFKDVDHVYKLMMLPFVVVYSVVSSGLESAGVSIGCIFDGLLSIKCWGCGMTRSLIALVHGNFDEAVRFHVAGPFVFLIIALISVTQFYRTFIRKD